MGRATKFSIVIISLSLLILTVSGAPQTGVLGTWRDINPTAYISPPANPPLNSLYMLSSTEGWAVGNARPSTESNSTITSDIEVDVKQQGITVTSMLNSPTGIVTGTGSIAVPAILYYDGSLWNPVPAPIFNNPLKPSAYTLNSVIFGPPGNPISRNDGWAVGSTFDPAAMAIHWDGVTWSVQRAGLIGQDAGPLLSAFMLSPTDVWAVGQNQVGNAGVFWHWTGVPGLGGAWIEPQPAVTTVAAFTSVFMVNPSEGWAVGTGGAIYHYSAGTWTAFSSPVSTTLRSVFMLSPTDGWAVGDGGVILRYTTGIWTGPVSPGTTSQDLLSVFMTASTEGWAVGKAGTILHYAGGTWTALPVNLVPTSPAGQLDFNTVFHVAASDGWMMGTAGVVLHWDGSNWGTVTSPTLNTLKSISFGPPLMPLNPNDGWAVGTAGGSEGLEEPTIIHWNGFVWTKGVAIGTRSDLNSVFMISSGDVWAVGGSFQTAAFCSTPPCPVILHFTGGPWSTVTPPPGQYILNSVFMVSPNEGWAVGCSGGQCENGIILHYTVTGGVGTWAIFPSPQTAPLNSVFMLGPNEGWAVGDNAAGTPTLLHYTVTGGVGTWNPVNVAGFPDSPSVANLYSIFMLSPTSGWAVGGILSPVCPFKPCSPTFFAATPVIIYWDGTKWTRVATPNLPGEGKPILRSVYFTGPNDGWAVGTPGILVSTIFHWDGLRWNQITLSPSLLGIAPPTIPPTLYSVYMISPSSGWIVGSPPDFSGTTIPTTKPLATILRFAPFNGILAATSTTTIVSTVTITTTVINTTSTQPNITTTSTTTTATSVPGFPVESIFAGISLGLAVLIVLRRARQRSKTG